MGVVTEMDLRARLARFKKGEIVLAKGDLITPSARDYLREHGIRIIHLDGDSAKNIDYESVDWKKPSAPETSGFVDDAGNSYAEKPENMTHLLGRNLVPKNHPRIIFRGKMDTLQAWILQTQVLAYNEGFVNLCEDLEEILSQARLILGAEVREIVLEKNPLLGYSEEELRKASHNPDKYFGVGHFLVSYKMGQTMAALNILRTQTREAELAAVNACDAEKKEIWDSFITALNRLSSAVYILMCRFLSNYYRKEGN